MPSGEANVIRATDLPIETTGIPVIPSHSSGSFANLLHSQIPRIRQQGAHTRDCNEGGASESSRSNSAAGGDRVVSGFNSQVELDPKRCTIDSKVLGRGSSADVRGGTYRFRGRDSGTRVAFKILRNGLHLSTDMRKKIMDELALGVQLKHANLVRMYGVIEDPHCGPALVLELCLGGSLRSVLDDGQRALSWTVRLCWLADIASGMVLLHSLLPNNVLHRDLKGANVVFSSEDLYKAQAKIADFGLAVTVGTIQSTSSVAATSGAAGTLAWKAPETFHGRLSKASDVYSFGVLCFELATRKVPFEGLSTQEIHKRVLKHFEYDEDLYQEDGIDEEKQRVRWHRRNPLKARRPDLALADDKCPPALIDLTVRCWADAAATRPCFSDIAASLELLREGRPYWGQGGDEEMQTLPEGPEKGAVVAAFLSSLSAYRVEVLSVQRVQNATLWDTFAAKKRTMLARPSATEDKYERSLFHGTDEDTAPKILAQGFNCSFCGKNATMYGRGVYFAKEAEYSARDIYSKPNSCGERFMFLCRVLVGDYCLGKQDAVTPDPRPGSAVDLYDSTVDSVQDPKIFVTYQDPQVYPEYLIKFVKHT